MLVVTDYTVKIKVLKRKTRVIYTPIFQDLGKGQVKDKVTRRDILRDN